MPQQQYTTFIPLLLFLVVMYFLIYRPQATQARRRREMLGKLREGDRIITMGGLHATILDVKEETLTLELAPNVKVKADRGAVQAVRGRQSKPA